MATTKEGWMKMPDGKELYTKSWLPSTPPTAQILFLHGYSDHLHRYQHFFPLLSTTGSLAIHAFDQRGWGRSVSSPSERGLTGKTSQVMSDITHFVQSHLPSAEGIPTFLMGHSMGGQETLYWACTGPEDIKRQLAGFVVLAPYLRNPPATQPAKLKVLVGRWAGRWMPHFQMTTKLDSSKLSHDVDDNKSYEADELCHDTGTLEGLAGMLDRAAGLDTGEVVLRDWEGLRVLAVHGDGDEVTSAEATKGFFERCKVRDSEVKVYGGCFHNLHIEPEKEQLRDDILAFVKRCSEEDKAAKEKSSGQSKL
ncbi:hypothetical protein MMC10_008309 [Thelotrema lepadinum]|nr:hypothetical protein [Thelotrema lepadinum]